MKTYVDYSNDLLVHECNILRQTVMTVQLQKKAIIFDYLQ